MRATLRWILLLLVPGGAAMAAPVPFVGTLRLEVGVGGQVALTFPAAGVAVVNGSGGGADLASLALPAGIVSGTATMPVTDPAAYPIRGLVGAASNAPGSFAETPGGRFGGAMALPGALRVCLFAPCSAPVANLSIPLDPVGAGGTAVWTADAVSVTVVGAPWTTGTVTPVPTFPSVTAMGFRHGPVTATSSAALASGSLQLVTPVLLRISFGTVPTPALATLTLHFVPEPGVAAPLAAGAALAAWRGARGLRERRRRPPLARHVDRGAPRSPQAA